MSFHYNTIDLPVKEVIPTILHDLANNPTLIVKAPPGAGKSTLIPLALLNEAWLKGKKIVMLEPRRLAAKAIASRMAQLLGEEVGKTVGYRVRFENRTSELTKIEVLTEGILTRILQSDNTLEDVGIVIFDEFHERSIHADLAMALCRESQQILRPDLKILVMSATLDMSKLAELLQAPTVVSEGKQYPVDVFYTDQHDEYLLPELTARTVLTASKKHEGDILVFLPGQGEILKCEELLKRELKGFSIHPLFGQLPQNKQYEAIYPNKNGLRKVVLATSIAETSLTIEGIKVVIDCGFTRTSLFNPKSGLSRLETVLISKDAADQRAGRAGRLSAGTCYRMWSKATHARLAEHRSPEIEQVDLSSLMLDMAHWGVTNINTLTWLTFPPKTAVSLASELLHELGALENGKITAHGKALYKLPCHPRIAHMLLKAELTNNVPLACDIAAIIEERDPLPKEKGIDISLRIEALRRYRKDSGQNHRFKHIEKIASSYRKLFDIAADNSPFDDYEVGFLLANAFPERIACARPGNNAQFQLANGKYAQAFHKDDLANEAWLAVANLDARDGMGKIFLASPLNPRDLAPLVKTKEIITWDTRNGGLIASLDLRIGSIVLQSKPLPNPNAAHLVQAISDAIKKEGKQLLHFDEEVENWQKRVLSLKKWNPLDGWPDVSTESLLLTNNEWLTPYLTNIKKPEELKKLNLKDILHYSLNHEQQQELESLCPTTITVPSGSNIKVQYSEFGEAPILAARLQELFGLPASPTVNNGKQKMLLHLLSPGYKPVQVTTDLNSFWNNTYHEVKKELKGRYPKHEWPEDPWTAEAIRGVKRKGG